MSNIRDQDSAKESQDNTVTLEGEWVQEAAESSAVGPDGSSATSESEEIVVACPTGVEDVGPEGNPEEEGNRAESVGIEEDSDIEAVEEEKEEEDEEQEQEESTLADQHVVVDAHHFPMAGFRVMFLDLVHAILNRVYYNDHILIRDPRDDQEMNSPNTCESSHSSELQVPPEPIPSTVRAADYDHQGSDLPEVISTFPELEEPPYFEETADHYLQEPTTRTAGQAIEEMAEAAAAEAAEDTAKEIIEEAIASKGENHCARQYEDGNVIDEDEEKGEGKKNEALDELDPDAANYCTSKFRFLSERSMKCVEANIWEGKEVELAVALQLKDSTCQQSLSSRIYKTEAFAQCVGPIGPPIPL
ncbi:cancer/testis antigen family 47 member A11 [Apodemus sylvaticus]|uniref:cancer/testis antigen family 47 member A11 n=1 Tax=Apodemus sylvaticus TaxID=10129 RepID=UPI0022447507|nr:cancer/testis antigen family 47 member A11 [Apodemus sylvaticus]